MAGSLSSPYGTIPPDRSWFPAEALSPGLYETKNCFDIEKRCSIIEHRQDD